MDATAAASWAQFAATVLGLGIAIAVPWTAHRAERRQVMRREQDRARDIALRIFGDLRVMRDRVAQLYHCMEGGFPETVHVSSVFKPIPTVEYLFIPESIDEAAPQLHALGNAAKPVQLMLLLYRELITDVRLAAVLQAMAGDFSTAELRESVRRCWAASRDAYNAAFALFSEVLPEGPIPEFVEPPITIEDLGRWNTPPKNPSYDAWRA